MSKAKYDPLEAAKLTAENTAAPKTPAPATVAASSSPASSSPPSTPMATANEAALSPKRTLYRVKEARQVSVRGQLVKMQAGRMIDPAGYDVDKLAAQGLVMEPVEV